MTKSTFIVVELHFRILQKKMILGNFVGKFEYVSLSAFLVVL